MKKAFDQTVRDLKREVNKKVLKAPKIEQKVLDATSNESWGPHGSLLADIAQASRNNHEYQIIMGVMWKRINDTGKNWRHVYKALTVLEYLVAHGTERVIDEIREHAYQIQTLSDFQYIDSSGRDQGTNVRKKSQSLVALVNDKERIQEVREKAAANRDKFRTASSGVHRPGDRYDEDRYRDDERNGSGREREDGYGRYEERYSRDDQYRGRSRDMDDYKYGGSRSRSSERYKERSYEDDGHYSSRRSEGKSDEHSQDGSVTGTRSEQKYSEQNAGAPPSYEEAVSATRSPTLSDRDGEAPPPKSASPPASTTSPPPPPPPQTSGGADAPPPTVSASVSPTQATTAPPPADAFDEFDPRGSFLEAPTTTTTSNAPTTTNTSNGGSEMDLFGFSDSFGFSSLALVTVPSDTADTSPNVTSETNTSSVPPNQAFDDPFGDGPFRAIPSSTEVVPVPVPAPAQQQNFTSAPNQFSEQAPQNAESGANYTPFGVSNAPTQYSHQEISASEQSMDDILADILPPTTGQNSQVEYHQHTSVNQPIPQTYQNQNQSDFSTQTQLGHASSLPNYPDQSGMGMGQQMNYLAQQGSQGGGYSSQTGQPGFPAQTGYPTQPGYVSGFPPQQQSYGGYNTQLPPQPPQQNNVTNFIPKSNSVNPLGGSDMSLALVGSNAPPVNSQPTRSASTGSLPQFTQPQKEFETKSTVWSDTLSRGLVNLNISGPKANPNSDIGVDFDALNRKDKRMEKPSNVPVVSTITMGKAMGSGSGVGRSGAGAIRPSPNQMVGGGMGMGMGGPRPGMGMGGGVGGGYGGGMNQPGGFSMGMNAPSNMGMGMGMGMGMNPQQHMGMGMGMNPQQNMGMGMNPQQNMGMGMNPQQNMGMGMNPQQNMGGMGMNPQQNMGGMGMNPQQNMGGMGMGGMNMPQNMGMGMGMGMGGQQMQQPGGVPPGGYTGNYNQQQYGGGGGGGGYR